MTPDSADTTTTALTGRPVRHRVIPAAGAHGGDAERVARALGCPVGSLLDLSASMNPAAADPLPILRRHLHAATVRYPDADRAEAALADIMGVDRSRLVLTNGGSEAIALVAAELGGHVTEPDFALYPRGAGTGGPRWRSNPHSPSGLLARPGDTAGVWDEAFYPIATGTWTRADPGVTVVGSLTKLLAAPGLRAGYVLAHPDIAAACRERQPAWSVNGLVAAALPDLLATVDLADTTRTVAELRRRLAAVLESHGLTCHPSDANWLLVDAPGLRERLAPYGVLVRDCAGFGMPGVARVAVPDAAGLARLDAALTAMLDHEAAGDTVAISGSDAG